MKKVHVIRFLPVAMYDFIVDGMDIRDYVGKYLSEETFNKFKKFIYEEIEKATKKFPLIKSYEELMAHSITEWRCSVPFLFTYGSDNKTYIQTGDFKFSPNYIAVLNVEIFNGFIY